MKITMLLSRLDQTGMTTHTLDLAEALVKKNHKVTVLVGYNKKPDTVSRLLMDRLKTTGVEIRTFYVPNKKSKQLLVLSAISLISRLLLWGGG